MGRPEYLHKYTFDWDLMDVVLSGKSVLDTRFIIGQIHDREHVNSFLKGYGLDPSDPVGRAELFGNFQEALQFIKRYFLREGNPDGLDFRIPNALYMITDIGDLFLMATGNRDENNHEERLWAEVILKVMHTILHVDKDLRSNYFSVIQTQIFDRYYRYLQRDGDQRLFLGSKNSDDKIPLVEFETKSKKSRDSVIVKLLHKAENVAEELFDRVGVRFVTKSKLDNLRVLKFLLEKNIVVPHNIKPSRSINSMVDLEIFKKKHQNLIRMAIRNQLDEARFLQALNREMVDCYPQKTGKGRNEYSSTNYKSIQFTCRNLIRYKNPFLQEFAELRSFAKETPTNELSKKVLAMDMSLVARDIRFFYPYEVQIVDIDAHRDNSAGEASHGEYKNAQRISAMKRVFKDLIEYKGI